MKSSSVLAGMFILCGCLKSAEKADERSQGNSFFESPACKQEKQEVRFKMAQLDREIAELKNRANPDRQKIEKKMDERCELYMRLISLSGSRFE